MTEISIFVDESGDFGEYSPQSPYYIIAMVIHDQSIDISKDLSQLETDLGYLSMHGNCIHSAPLIRKELDYSNLERETRKKIMKKMMTFFRRCPVKCKSFYIEKKNIEDEVMAVSRLSKQISSFIKDNYPYFLSRDKIKIYYDNGQVEVNKMLASVFNTLLDNVEFKKVLPSEYRLFQAADLVCTLKLLMLKLEAKALSKSEKDFFDSERTLKKNYLKPMNDKEF